jgi:hypothetical protein
MFNSSPNDWPPIESRFFSSHSAPVSKNHCPAVNKKVRKKWSAGDLRKVLCGEVITHTYDGLVGFSEM